MVTNHSQPRQINDIITIAAHDFNIKASVTFQSDCIYPGTTINDKLFTTINSFRFLFISPIYSISTQIKCNSFITIIQSGIHVICRNSISSIRPHMAYNIAIFIARCHHRNCRMFIIKFK